MRCVELDKGFPMCQVGRLEAPCEVHLREESARARKALFEAQNTWNSHGGASKGERDQAVFEYDLTMNNLEICHGDDPVITSTREVLRARAEAVVRDLRVRASVLNALTPELSAKIDDYEKLSAMFLSYEALATTRHLYSVSDETRHLARRHSAVTYLRMDEMLTEIEQVLEYRYYELGSDAVADLWSEYTKHEVLVSSVA